MNTEANRQRFLERIQKYEKRYKIKQMHHLAVSRRARTYLDPETGFLVMTSEFLESRGFCCESGCRHCPWDYKRERR